MISGEVRSVRAFDYEVEQSFVLEITVVDNATTNPLTDTAQLIISISDINDNSPFFVDFPSNVSYSEATPVGASIVNITASDMDATTNAQVRINCLLN